MNEMSSTLKTLQGLKKDMKFEEMMTFKKEKTVIGDI